MTRQRSPWGRDAHAGRRREARTVPFVVPEGNALDFMTTSGDAIADCAVQNADALGISYVIWNQRINTGSGWERMEDRGGATANHEDHVHLSFSHGASPDVSVLRSCR